MYAKLNREYPVSWITRNLEKANMKIKKVKKYTILHSEDSMNRQINVAQNKLQLLPNHLKSGMESYLSELRYILLYNYAN